MENLRKKSAPVQQPPTRTSPRQQTDQFCLHGFHDTGLKPVCQAPVTTKGGQFGEYS